MRRHRRLHIRHRQPTPLTDSAVLVLDLGIAIAARRGLALDVLTENSSALGGAPRRYVPANAGEGAHLEAALGPLATGLAGAVEGAEAGVDGALVGFGAELVGGNGRLAVGVVAGEGLVFSRDGVGILGMKGTYVLAFLDLGPGLPRGLAAPSGPSAAAPLFVPLGAAGFLRLLPGGGGASEPGVLTPFMAPSGVAFESAGVSTAGAGSVTLGRGVSEGADVDLGAEGADEAGVCGKAASLAGASLRMTMADLAGLKDAIAEW